MLTSRLSALALMSLLLFASGAPAGNDQAFETVVLENGLTLLLAPSHAHPVIAASCFVTTGGRTEDHYYQGSLHYIEHLVFKGGTPNLEPTQFRKKMSLLGRESGGWTWDDEINFGFEVPKENFREAMETFREAMLDLEFEKQWFEDEKLVVLQEMTRGFEQPDRMVFKAWSELAFVVHPYGRPVIGSEKAIRELDMDKTYEYYKQRFTPNHMILSLAGDFDKGDLVETVREIWGTEQPGPDSFELGLAEPEQKGPRTRVDYVPQASTAVVVTGLITPGGTHEDTPALDMLAALMNNGSYGLPQYLIEQEKWVSSVEASHYPMRDYGSFYVFFRSDAEKERSVTDFVSSFLFDFDVRQIPADVFEETRRELLFDEARERESVASRAGRLGFLMSRRGKQGARELVGRYESLSADDVQAAKERWFGPRRLVTAVILPEDFDDTSSDDRPIHPGAPYAPAPPDLRVAGALEPSDSDPLSYTKTDEADGVHAYTYANGLRVLVRPTDASVLLGISGRVLGGQWVEEAGQEGINRFVSELGMRTTRRWNRESFARLLGSYSISASAHASVGSRANTSRNVDYRDSAAHHYLGLADQWKEMLAILKETLFFPNYDSGEIEKLRSDLVTEIRSLDENNLELIKQEFYVTAYAGHPYGRPTVGTEESVGGLTAADLEVFHRDRWTPARTVVTIVGDVDPDELARWIASRWGDLDPAEAEPWTIAPADWPLPWSPPQERQILDLGKDYWTVNWGRPGVTYGDPKYFPSVVLSRIAGNDHFYKYVYGEGVSYRSWIRFWENLGPGAWIVENDVKRERFDEILAKFDEDLIRYSTDGFPQEEFDSAVQRLVNSSILNRQDNRLLAWRLAVAEGNGAGFRRITGEVDEIRAVAYDDVQTLSAAVFGPGEILRVVQQ